MEGKLGRGLSILLGKESEESKNRVLDSVNIKLIVPNKNQPRRYFDEDQLKELTQSIKKHGVLQPIIVRRCEEGYELIAGERRWRAAQSAGLQEIPTYIIECSDSEILTFSLVENIQRVDLNPIEEAEAIKKIMEESRCRQEDLAHIIGKSRSYVANSLRLLTLSDFVRTLIKEKKITAGHGRCLVGVEEAEELARITISEDWNVRQLEETVRELKSEQIEENAETETIETIETSMAIYEDPDAQEIAARISAVWRVQAKLKITKKGGVLTLICNSCESLEALTTSLLIKQE